MTEMSGKEDVTLAGDRISGQGQKLTVTSEAELFVHLLVRARGTPAEETELLVAVPLPAGG